ncbi:hypothetical protein HPP92_007186 [Vanilla planifolia]|uniref:Uncharacterized protein n=1 Tax=Vanilla planifolia TaxID=51239 RepID=A0A835V9E1_VANPL|nr:hypothetical protein HPP92_007416 [Vanilla planifolia]KAG0490323.1 hypothetical protein HPP92_007186 [Vanilla planifolia]
MAIKRQGFDSVRTTAKSVGCCVGGLLAAEKNRMRLVGVEETPAKDARTMRHP